MKAQRHNKGKQNWGLLDRFFPVAQEAELECRMYGVEKYTDIEKGIDGEVNWKASMGTEHHDEFMWGCLESANRHLRAMRLGEMVDEESGCFHGGFVRLNIAMFMAYYSYRKNQEDQIDKVIDNE